MMIDWTIAPITAGISVLVAIYLYFYINRQDAGSEKMQEISNAIAEGASAFMKVEFKYLAVFVAVMAAVLTLVPLVADIGFSYLMGIAFVFGAVCSAVAGVLGMTVALKANVRSANAAKEGLNKAFPIAFRGGAVMGLAVVGLALLRTERSLRIN